METLRAFIAITLDDTLKETIGRIQNHFKKTGADVKWVSLENIHLTLKFLGDTPLNKIEAVKKIIQETTQSIRPFLLELSHVGAFPKIENPQIIWVGMEQGKNETQTIALLLKEKLEKIGFKKERRDFDPHLTIGRRRSSMNRFALAKSIKAYSLSPKISQEVNHLILFKSTLTPHGPIYEALERVDLKKP